MRSSSPARRCAAGVAAEIEATIGKPVVTSNLATAWACLRLCGDDAVRPELGAGWWLAYPGRLVMADLPATLADIEQAARRIEGRILRTPFVLSASLSERCGVPVGLKLEHHQTTGSFKLRGATNAVLSLSPDERARGVVAASTGNHGRALSHAAKAEGSVATICMSRLVPENKVVEIRRLGANVRIVGKIPGRGADRGGPAGRRRRPRHGPADNPAVVAGQGTLGLEIMDAMPDAATVLVPLSGGGLAAGVAAAVKGRSPKTRVIGLTMARGAAMKASLDAGQPVQVEEMASPLRIHSAAASGSTMP